jgi:transposase
MEVLYRSCCGIDVHKQFLVACLLVVDEKGCQHKELRRFSTMTGELQQCVDWLEAARCQAVAMESTGVYWRPPFNLLEGHIETVMIVNAEHLKRVPGRKTDKKDAEWIAELLQFGLLKPSFIPSQEQRELRDLTRLRTTLTAERTRLVNRLHKTLEDTNLKLSSVLTDIMGKTGQQILFALLRGEEDPAVLADLALGRAMSKRDALTQALRGHISDHHRLLLQELLSLIERHTRGISQLDREIEEWLRPYEALITRLDAIPGCSRRIIARPAGRDRLGGVGIPGCRSPRLLGGDCALYHAREYPWRSQEELERRFLGHWLTSRRKTTGTRACHRKRKNPEDAYCLVPQDPRNRVRARLPEAQFPIGVCPHPSLQRLRATSPHGVNSDSDTPPFVGRDDGQRAH